MDASIRSQATDLLPNPLAGDCQDALRFWLRNPLLLHHFPQRAQATAERLLTPGLTNGERLQMLMNLRAAHLRVRAGRRAPEGLPGLSLSDMYWLFEQIETKDERCTVRAFAARLADCERPWFAQRLEAALTARRDLRRELLGDTAPEHPIPIQ